MVELQQRGRKYSQVFEGAKKVFFEHGYAGASVDDIAREAGVSKATLYSYFSDKKLMFSEVFRGELQKETTPARVLADIDQPPQQILPLIARLIALNAVNPNALQLHRVAVAEATRFPVLAREYHDAGPARLINLLTSYLQRSVVRGELAIDDIELAATQLMQLAGASLSARLLLLGPDCVGKDTLDKMVASAVMVFMAAYGVKSRA